MEQIGAFEAKNHLSSLLDRAEKGEEILITKHGRPVARLGPPSKRPPMPDFDREKARKAAEGLLKTRKGITLGGLKIKDLQNAGRP